ncbi:MAG: hypothetical protein AAF196_02940 [Planctomycetota bacterium]
MQLCPRCLGRQHACGLCKGSGKWILHECPGRRLDPGAQQVLNTALFALEHGVLPGPGSLLDQTKDFQLALSVVSRLKAIHQKQLLDKGSGD